MTLLIFPDGATAITVAIVVAIAVPIAMVRYQRIVRKVELVGNLLLRLYPVEIQLAKDITDSMLTHISK